MPILDPERFAKPGPGVSKNAAPKKGLPRFFEIMGRDFFHLFQINLLTLACLLPAIMPLSFFIYAQVKPFWLLLLAWLGLLPAGPALAAMHKLTLNMVQDIPCFEWQVWKTTYRKNCKQGMAAVLLFGAAFFGLGIAVGDWLLLAEKNYLILAAIALALVTTTCVFHLTFSQIALLELPLSTMIKNAFLLTFARADRSIPAVLMILLVLGFLLFFTVELPFFGFLFLFGTLAVLTLVGNLWMFPALQLIMLPQKESHKKI